MVFYFSSSQFERAFLCVCKTKTDKSELGQGKGREGEGWEMFEFSVDDDRYP